MPDPLTDDERQAIAAFTGRVQVIPIGVYGRAVPKRMISRNPKWRQKEIIRLYKAFVPVAEIADRIGSSAQFVAGRINLMRACGIL